MDATLEANIRSIVADPTKIPGWDPKAADISLHAQYGQFVWVAGSAAPVANPAATKAPAAASQIAADPVPVASLTFVITGKTALGPTEDSTTLTSPVAGEWSLPTPNGANFWGGKNPTGTSATINGIKTGTTIVQLKTAAGTTTVTITK